MARVDSGAASSALHCQHIETHTAANGTLYVQFTPLDSRYPQWNPDTPLQLPVWQQHTVVSSNGQREQRYFVLLEVQLGADRFTTPFSLTNRKQMRFPILIGRTLLRKRYLIDVSRKFLANKNLD
jgi:hypothetical protein